MNKNKKNYENNPIICLENIGKRVYNDGGFITILENISFKIYKNEFLVILGKSGSGKSSLLNIIGCIDTAMSGSYLLNNNDISNLKKDNLASLRSTCFGFIFQRYNLIQNINVIDNVSLPALYAGTSNQKRKAAAKDLLKTFGIETKINYFPNELSGGEQQRVCIARALINNCDIILADEPTGALDSSSGKNVINALLDLHKQGKTVVIVTHDREIANYATHLIEISDGTITRDETTKISNATSDTNDFDFRESRAEKYFSVLLDVLRMALKSLLQYKLRSTLTMLGIIIGIASVITVVALGDATKQKILNEIKTIGTNTIEIFPGSGFGDTQSWRVTTLSVADAEALSRLPFINNTTPNIIAPARVSAQSVNVNTQVIGVSDKYAMIKGLVVTKGRFFSKNDILYMDSVGVIDEKLALSLFKPSENPTGKIVQLNKTPITVIGVIKTQSTSQSNSETPIIYLPYTCLQHKIIGNSKLTSIIVKIYDSENAQEAENNIIQFLKTRHSGIKDFFTFNSDSIKKIVEKTTSSMSLLVSCIALISLFVGGVGVMNIMLVSVAERTSEIGIRMAVGAQRSTIFFHFFIESIVLCSIGGIIGIAISLWTNKLVGLYFPDLILTFSVYYATLAIIFSTITGCLFGFLPAYRASILSPVEALRELR